MNQKSFTMIVGGVLCLTMLTACSGGSGSGQASKTSSVPDSPPQITDTVKPTPTSAPAIELESAGTLADYSIEIKDFLITSDSSGFPAIVITYTFTNHGEDATSVMSALSEKAFQNGVELVTARIGDSSVCNTENSTLKVKAGGSLDIQQAFSLTSETAPVEFEIGELFSFSGELLGKTFSIADGGVTELSAIEIPEDAVTSTIEGCEISIISCVPTKDYEGNDAVVVTFGYKNNRDKAVNPLTTVSYRAYQDSVQLTSATILDNSIYDATYQMRHVKPGAAILFQAAYSTTNTSPVEVEVSTLFDENPVSRTFILE